MDKRALFNLFKTGIEKEQFAQKFYEELIRETADPEQRKILSDFLKQEQMHERSLSEMYAELKAELEEK